METEEKLKVVGELICTIRDRKTGAIKRVHKYKNTIVTVGKAVVANAFTAASPSPSSPRVNKVALGSNTTAPAAGNTGLGTEVYRNDVASEVNSNNIAYITGFFSATEVTGTFKEAGLFIAGAAGAGTGTLLSHVAINITKGATETLTIDWTITIS